MKQSLPMVEWLKPLRIRTAAEYYLVFVAALIPWQAHKVIRKGITSFHVINGFLVFGILIALMVRGPRPKWHLIIPIYVYYVGSVLGMFSSEVYSINIYTLVQDVYLYLWFIVMCVMFSSRQRVELLAVAWALVLVVVLSTEGFIAATGDAANRGEFTFRNPNRAASYLLLSFFILLHPTIPWLLKGVLGALVINGIGATGSAAGSLGLGLGVGACLWAIAYARSPRGFRPLLVLGVVAVGLMVAVINPLSDKSLTTVLGEMAPAAAPRIERSAGTREEIWAKGMESFWEHPMGIGPASFHRQIDSGISDDGAIELHSDFVSSLVERGVVGLVGFLMLIGATVVTVFRMLHRSHRWRDIVWSAALTGASTSYFFYCVTHEALHHETFWLMLALVVSQERILHAGREIEVPVNEYDPIESLELVTEGAS